jgi:hypothetical protein
MPSPSCKDNEKGVRQFAIQILLSPVSLKQSLRDTPKAGSNGVNPSQPDADVVPTGAVLVHQLQVVDSKCQQSLTHSVTRTRLMLDADRRLPSAIRKPEQCPTAVQEADENAAIDRFKE